MRRSQQFSRMFGVLAVVALLFPIVSCPALASSDPWVRSYEAGSFTVANDMIVVDNGLVIAGLSRTAIGDRLTRARLLKIDLSGDVVWDHVYSNRGGSAEGIIERSDGSYLACGFVASEAGDQDIYLLCVDANGQELWSREWGASLGEYVHGIQPTADGGSILVGNIVDPEDMIVDPGTPGYDGYAGRSNPLIVKLDADDQVAWSRQLVHPGNVLAAAIRPKLDGGYVVLARELMFPIGRSEMLLYQLDAEGEQLNLTRWMDGSTRGYDLQATPDGCFLIAGAWTAVGEAKGDASLWKVTADGREQWVCHFGDPEHLETANVVAVGNDGNIYTAGWRMVGYDSPEDEDAVVSAFDADGVLMWQKSVASYQHMMFAGIAQLSDQDLALAISVFPRWGNRYIEGIRTTSRAE